MGDSVYVSACCKGEVCFCGRPAIRKLGEEIFFDDPLPHRHNLTAYVCGEHFAMILGPHAARSVGLAAPPPPAEAPALGVEGLAKLIVDNTSVDTFGLTYEASMNAARPLAQAILAAMGRAGE